MHMSLISWQTILKTKIKVFLSKCSLSSRNNSQREGNFPNSCLVTCRSKNKYVPSVVFNFHLCSSVPNPPSIKIVTCSRTGHGITWLQHRNQMQCHRAFKLFAPSHHLSEVRPDPKPLVSSVLSFPIASASL